DQADRLAGGSQVERTDVQISDLLGRKHGETASATNDTRNVLGIVEMRCNTRTVAQPDGLDHRVNIEQLAQIVCTGKARQVDRQGDRAGVQRRRRLLAQIMLKPVQHVAEQRALGLKIEAIEPVVVEKSAVDRRRPLEQW